MLRISEHWEDSNLGLQRQGNEDSFFVRAPLFVVADGMGGAQAGEVASEMAVESFESGLPDGRSRDADVVLDDPNVSRHHAEVRPSGGSWIVNDLGSTNGIKLNGRRVRGAESLKRGDVIELGTSRVTFDLG